MYNELYFVSAIMKPDMALEAKRTNGFDVCSSQIAARTKPRQHIISMNRGGYYTEILKNRNRTLVPLLI